MELPGEELLESIHHEEQVKLGLHKELCSFCAFVFCYFCLHNGCVLLALWGSSFVDRSDHVCILCLHMVQGMVESDMEVCI